MNKTIKTRSVVKNIKTFTRTSPAQLTLEKAAIKTRDVALNTVPTPDDKSEPDQTGLSAPLPRLARKKKSAATESAEQTTEQRSSAQAHKHDKEHLQQSQVEHSQKLSHTTLLESTSFETSQQNPTLAPEQSKSTPAEKKASGAPRKPTKAKSTSKRTSIKTPSRTTGTQASSASALKTHAQRLSHSKQVSTRSSKAVASIKEGARSFTKMAVASAKSLTSSLAALGLVATSSIIIICLVGFVASSAFGIFFTGGDMGNNNPTLREVITRINTEHASRIDDIKAANPHDEFVLAGSKTPWKETLAVFAVRATTDAINPLDVLTLDETRQNLLSNTFWDMNQLKSHVEKKEVIEVVLEEDEDGNSIETTKTTTRTTLYVTLSNKTVEEAVGSFGFTALQIDLVHQLLDKQYDTLWNTVLYGVGRNSSDIVEVAASQIGNIGGAPYWSWYGFSGRVEWCACFVSWCANEVGYIEDGLVPKFAYCPSGIQWFKDAGRWQERGYTPQSGDIIFFDWQGDGVSDHVGIVESCDGSTVYTIEGNSGDACQRNSYSVGGSTVAGYGIL